MSDPILAELGLTLAATDDEIAVAARRIDREAPEDAESAIRALAKGKTMRLTDLELPADILADAIRYRDDLGHDKEEFLAEALEIGWDQEVNSEDGPAPLRVRFPDDRARMRYGVELRVDQLREVEAQADPE